MLKQLPAVLFWQAASGCASHYDVEVPVVGWTLKGRFFDDAIGSYLNIVPVVAFEGDFELAIVGLLNAFALIEAIAQSPRQSVQNTVNLTARVGQNVERAALSPSRVIVKAQSIAF